MAIDLRTERVTAAMDLSARGQHDRAMNLVIDLVSEDPTCPIAHRAWGRLLLDQGRTSDAVAAYRAAIEFAPGDVQVRYELTYTLIMHAEKSPFMANELLVEARQVLAEAEELDPKSTVAPSLAQLITARSEGILV